MEDARRRWQAAPIFSNVKDDPFHATNRIRVPKNHGAASAFRTALANAIFICHPSNLAALEAFCRRRRTSLRKLMWQRRKWALQRIRRYIPPPDVLAPAIERVCNRFGRMRDHAKGTELFNEAAWDQAARLVETARRGLLSDSPNVLLYSEKGLDAFGLMRYSCRRGTNNVEGILHGAVYHRFGAMGASPRLANAILQEERSRNNIRVSPSSLWQVLAAR